MRRRPWTPDEDKQILSLQKQWGNQWAAIAKVVEATGVKG